MEIRKNLELVAVDYESNNQKAILTFLDEERGEVRQVSWNKQAYKDGKFVPDDEKAAKAEEWAKTYFNCKFVDLVSAIGQKKDVYIYDKFNSLWECDVVAKFTEDMVGQIYQTNLKAVTVDDVAIRLRYDIEGKTYESKMTFAKYVEALGKWFVDPDKRKSVFAKFDEKYGVPVAKADTLIKHPLMVEVKTAFGTNYYGDIKKFPSKKK